MASTEILQLDYTFNFGKYGNIDERIDKNNVEVKLNAILLILHMRPGTLQDNPFCGISMDGLLFAEQTELNQQKNRIESEVLSQADKYVQNGFLTNVDLVTEKVADTNDGSMQITMTMELSNKMVAYVESVQTPTGLIFKKAVLDTSPFTI